MNAEKVVQYVATCCVIVFVAAIGVLFVGLAILAGAAGAG